MLPSSCIAAAAPPGVTLSYLLPARTCYPVLQESA